MNVRLYLAQRISAVVMVPLVLGHLLVMIMAVQNGLTADEILARTRGSVGWALFYGLFVIAVSVHAAIGLRTVLSEWIGWRGRSLTIAVLLISALMLVLGMRAVVAVIAG